MKNNTLRLIALITALLLALPLFGCLVKDDEPQSDAQTVEDGVKAPEGLDTATDTSEPTTAPDPNAVAIELGEIRITVDELKNTYTQYINYFAQGYGLDEEMLDQFMSMTEESLIEFYMPQWKAAELGLTLSEEDEAEIAAEADRAVEEERNYILCMFAQMYAGADEDIEDASQLTDEQLSTALEEIRHALEDEGEDFTFDEYLEMRRKDAVDEYRSDRCTELLREYLSSSVLSDPGVIDERYEAMLAAQKERFDADHDFYLACQNGDDIEDEFLVCLYVPAESARLEVIRVRTEDPDDTYAETETRMKELEAEYGALALNGEDEARRAEIEAEYAELKEKLETDEVTRTRAAQHKVDNIAIDLDNGMSFEEAMNTYNEPGEDGSGRSELVILTVEDPQYPELSEAVAALKPGAYSEAIRIGDEYYIVRLVERIPAGTIDRASVEESFRAVLLSDAASDDAWQEQYDAWYTEALETAVYHRDAYASIKDAYLPSDY